MSEVQVDSINPNTPVTSNLTKDGKIEADAAGGPLSFDELEELTMKSKKAKAEKSEEPKEKTEKSKDLTSDTDKGKKVEKAASKKEDDSSGKEAEKSEDTPKRKTVKAKYSDNEYDLDEESVVNVKINGEETPVMVKDLLSNYSGKVGWDKKFSEIDKTRKTLATQELKLKESSEQIKSIFEEQDPNIKMYKMAMLAGVDPVQFRQKFFDENISALEKYHAMSDDERKADALSYEAAIQKHRADTLEKSAKEKQEYDSLQSKVAQLRASHQISESEFVTQYDKILEAVSKGILTKEDLNPEFIVDTIKKDRLWNAAEKQLESLGLDWDQKTKSERLRRLVEHSHTLKLEPSLMAEMVDELWGVKKAQKKIEEKKAENKEFLSGKKDVQQVTAKSSEPVFFDDV